MTNYEYGFLTKLAQWGGQLQPGQERPLTNPFTDSIPGDPSGIEMNPRAEAALNALAPKRTFLDDLGRDIKATASKVTDFNKYPIGTSVAAGGIVGGLSGLLYEALRKQRDSMDRKDYLKRFLVGALIGTGAGGATGVGIDQYRKSQPLPQPKL